MNCHSLCRQLKYVSEVERNQNLHISAFVSALSLASWIFAARARALGSVFHNFGELPSTAIMWVRADESLRPGVSEQHRDSNQKPLIIMGSGGRSGPLTARLADLIPNIGG